MKNQCIQEKGITLIALVITIIILLILSGVTISIVMNDGLIEKSQNAVDKYIAQQQNETEIIDYINEQLGLQITNVDNLKGKENKKAIDEEEYTYYNPVVPVGFKTVNTLGASWDIVEDEILGKVVKGWNNGLVIEDSIGNQFVWVPVDGKDVIYEKWLGANNTYSKEEGDIFSTVEDSLELAHATPVDEDIQISKYHGFYIARYEAGIPEMKMKSVGNVSGIPVSKKNQVPWNYIGYNKAKENAENMYTDGNVKSGLLTGKMWDTVMLWIKNTGEDVEYDSTSWGNYKDSPVTGITWYSPSETVNDSNDKHTGTNWIKIDNPITKPISGSSNEEYIWLLRTGNTEYTKRKNIYDLAGNLWEWTNEKVKTEGYANTIVYRGGSYGSLNSPLSAAYRTSFSSNNESPALSFRVALYIQ